MIRHLIIVTVLLVVALIFIPISERHSTSPESQSPLDDDSAIPRAPEPQILATTTATTTEPEPIPEPLPLPRRLPPGVKCLDDCPLIDPDVVKKHIKDYFKDTPVMIAIAECESTFRQYDPETGEPLPNGQGSSAIGVFQIMASYHADPASEMGWDIRDFNGNVRYAEYLYETQGTKPWEASQKCWGSANMAINKGISDTERVSPFLSYES